MTTVERSGRSSLPERTRIRSRATAFKRHKPQMKYQLSIRDKNRRIPADSGTSVLDACLNAGIEMNYRCRSGECGECVSTLWSGEIYELPGCDPAVFNQAHRDQGKILSCMSYPRSDASISLPPTGSADAGKDEWSCEVQAVTLFHSRIAVVVVESAQPIEYLPGQYFDWKLPGIAPNRAYSAANVPGTTQVQFHVRLHQGGAVSEYIRNGRLAVGSTLCLKGPHGRFTWSPDDYRPAVLVAGGTGFAPVRALIEHAVSRRSGRRLHVFCGARCADELYFDAEMRQLVREQGQLTYVPVLSDEPAGSSWAGMRGMVTDAIPRHLGSCFGYEAYLCGPPAMIDAAIPVLRTLGIDDIDIYSDKFLTAAGNSDVES